jgi:hypothetical protein
MPMAKPTWLSERMGYSTNTGRVYLFYNDGSPSRPLPPPLMLSSLVKRRITISGIPSCFW